MGQETVSYPPTHTTCEEHWLADEETRPTPMRGPIPAADGDDGDDDQGPTCSACGGVLGYLGRLGNADWFSCRHCGMEHWEKKQENEEVTS